MRKSILLATLLVAFLVTGCQSTFNMQTISIVQQKEVTK